MDEPNLEQTAYSHYQSKYPQLLEMTDICFSRGYALEQVVAYVTGLVQPEARVVLSRAISHAYTLRKVSLEQYHRLSVAKMLE